MEADHPELHGFSLRYMDGRAVLIVMPENRRSRPLYTEDILARMKLLGIPPVSARRIREIIEKGSGLPEPLADWADGAQLGARIILETDPAAMEVHARVQPPHPGGEPAGPRMIEKALADLGIVHGIDREACRRLVDDLPPGTEIVVARGDPPEPGSPARTECLFITRRGRPWKELAGGRVDLKELNFIQNRKAGELLARHIRMVPARAGCDVRGRMIEAEPVGEGVLLRAGSGVLEIDDGLEAATDGNARIEDGAVIVEPSISVKNVDYSTGHIDFDGSVNIEETVADGFSVRAAGEVQVGKTVGRVHIEAARNLVLGAGIVGDGEGSCTCGGHLFSRFLESSKATAGGDVLVTEAVLHSALEAGGHVVMTEGRGEITGGIVIAGGSVICKRIGNVYAGSTRITVGCPPSRVNGYYRLAGELKALRIETDELELQLEQLKSRSASTAQEQTDLERAVSTRNERMKADAARLRDMKDRMEAANGTFIAVEERIHPGVSIRFGLDEFPVGDKGLERVLLKRENGRTVMHGLKPGEIVELASSLPSGAAEQDTENDDNQAGDR